MIGLAHAVGAGKAQDWRVLRSPRRLGPGEVVVLQCRARIDAAPWVVGQERVEEVHTVDADLCLGVADVLPALARPLGERRLELRQLHEAWPLLDRGRAQLLEDPKPKFAQHPHAQQSLSACWHDRTGSHRTTGRTSTG